MPSMTLCFLYRNATTETNVISFVLILLALLLQLLRSGTSPAAEPSIYIYKKGNQDLQQATVPANGVDL